MIYDDIWWYMIIIFLIFPHFFMIFMGIWCMYQLLLDIATPPSQGDERILRWISTGRTTTTTAGLPNPGLTGATLTYRGPREGYGNVWHHYHDQWLTMDHEIDHCEYPNQWSFMWIFTMGLMGIFTFISISDIYKMSDITFININGDIHNDQSWWWMLIKGDACQWWWRVMNGITLQSSNMADWKILDVNGHLSYSIISYPIYGKTIEQNEEFPSMPCLIATGHASKFGLLGI